MTDHALAFATPASAPRAMRWLLFSPLARIAWFTTVALAMGVFGFRVAALLGWAGRNASPIHQAYATVLAELVPMVIAYLGLVVLLEMRAPSELIRRPLPGLLSGLASGLCLISVIVGAMWGVGSYHVTGLNPNASWAYACIRFGLCAGLAEELLFRGVFFRICEEGLGTWIALAASALLFGADHITNAGATAWSAIAIAIEFGLLLAMIYHVTRSLWPCVGMHAAWNVAQGSLYGIPVSGYDANGLLLSNRTGPDWLSGGAFGAEGSVVAVSVCTACTLALVAVAMRRGTIVPLRWDR